MRCKGSQILHLAAAAVLVISSAADVPPARADSRDDWCAEHQADQQRCLSADDAKSLAQQEKNIGSTNGAVAIMVAAGAASGQPEVIAAAGIYKEIADILNMLGAFDSPDPTSIALNKLQDEIDTLQRELNSFR